MDLLEKSHECDEVDGPPSDGEHNMLENGEWLDMDAAVSNYCRRTGNSIPLDLEEKTRLHQEALHLWINQS
jgi:hypothetical protein